MNHKLFFQFRRLPHLLIIGIAVLMLLSCKKKDKGDPPNLPPAETMQIDFSNFILASHSISSGFDAKGTNDANWTTAVEIVSPWRTLSADIPVSSYRSATSQGASHVSGAKWEWSNSNVRLTGETTGAQVKWEMFVSDIKRLDGTSNTSATEGKWTIYEGQTPLLQIDYTDSGKKITYTYLKDGQNKGAYIEFGSTQGSYNFYYKVRYYNTNLTKFSEADIEWNHTTKAGRICSADYLDGSWKQWDGQKMDL